MTNEEFQKLVLEKFDNVQGQIGEIGGQIGEVRSQIGEVREQIDEVRGQQNETNGIVKALMHRTEEMSAQLHGVSHAVDQLSGRVATIEKQQNSMGEDIAFLVRKAGEHDSALWKIRRAE